MLRHDLPNKEIGVPNILLLNKESVPNAFQTCSQRVPNIPFKEIGIVFDMKGSKVNGF